MTDAVWNYGFMDLQRCWTDKMSRFAKYSEIYEMPN